MTPTILDGKEQRAIVEQRLGDYSNTALKRAHYSAVPIDPDGNIVSPETATQCIWMTRGYGHVPSFFYEVPVYDEPPEQMDVGEIVMYHDDGRLIQVIYSGEGRIHTDTATELFNHEWRTAVNG